MSGEVEGQSEKELFIGSLNCTIMTMKLDIL